MSFSCCLCSFLSFERAKVQIFLIGGEEMRFFVKKILFRIWLFICLGMSNFAAKLMTAKKIN